MLKLKQDYFTEHLGFIADYIAEIFHNELRQLNFTDYFVARALFAEGHRIRKNARSNGIDLHVIGGPFEGLGPRDRAGHARMKRRPRLVAHRSRGRVFVVRIEGVDGLSHVVEEVRILGRISNDDRQRVGHPVHGVFLRCPCPWSQ